MAKITVSSKIESFMRRTPYEAGSKSELLTKFYYKCMLKTIRVLEESAPSIGHTLDSIIHVEGNAIYGFIDIAINKTIDESGYKLKPKERKLICIALRENIKSHLQDIKYNLNNVDEVRRLLVTNSHETCGILDNLLNTNKAIKRELLKKPEAIKAEAQKPLWERINPLKRFFKPKRKPEQPRKPASPPKKIAPQNEAPAKNGLDRSKFLESMRKGDFPERPRAKVNLEKFEEAIFKPPAQPKPVKPEFKTKVDINKPPRLEVRKLQEALRFLKLIK
ncbi:MAG: hypothetical protein ABIH00_00200 [Armatimonadota bacterium]